MSDNKILSFDELGDELCSYCPLNENEKGVHCYGSYPVICADSGYCEKAYQNYLDFMQGKIKDLKSEIQNQIKERELEVARYEDLNDLSIKKNNKFKKELLLLETEIKHKFGDKKRLLKSQIKVLKDKVIEHQSAVLFNEYFGDCAKRDGADISEVTKDILSNEIFQMVQEKINELEDEYKSLIFEEDNYYKEHKEIIYKEIDKWYLEESDKIRSKYGKKYRKEIL